MALGGVEEHRKIGRLVIMCFLGFASCNHMVKAFRVPSAGDGGALDNFSVNFNSQVLLPLDRFRLAMGDSISIAGSYCPDALGSTCEAATTGMRFVLGLH